jgi:hypothetical protein
MSLGKAEHPLADRILDPASASAIASKIFERGA